MDFSTSQNYVNQKKRKDGWNLAEANGTNSGNYALKTGITIYNGSKLTNSLRQQEVINKSRQFQVDMAGTTLARNRRDEKPIWNILYANENVKISRQTNRVVRRAQLERSSKACWKPARSLRAIMPRWVAVQQQRQISTDQAEAKHRWIRIFDS